MNKNSGHARMVQFSRLGGPEVLELVEMPLPPLGDDEILIRIKAIGVNRSDALFRRGEYLIPPTFPAHLGTEAAGVVEAVGRKVTHLAVGEPVNILPSFMLGDVAIYADRAVVPAHAVVAQPPGLSAVEAAALWVMLLTPYGALVEDAQIGAGEPVLISAASSSTGIGAIQIANLVGAIPIALTRTSAKRQQLLDAGAKHVIAFDEVDAAQEIMKITDGKGVRIAFDPVGGRLLPQLIQSLAWKGIIYSYGSLDGETTTIPVMQLLGRMGTIKSWAILDTLWDSDRLKTAIAFITAAVTEGKLSPVIDRLFPLEDVVAAHEHLERSEQFGKIVIAVA